MLEARSPVFQMRVADLGDTPELYELVHLAYRGGKATVDWKNENHLVKGQRITEPELQRIVIAHASTILVAEGVGDADSSLVGCVMVEDKGNEQAVIGLLAVHPDCQNLGLARKLVKAAEEYAAQELGCTLAKMLVLSARVELLSWYKRLGYQETGFTVPFPTSDENMPQYSDAHFIAISKRLPSR